jgi:hypothetical protein
MLIYTKAYNSLHRYSGPTNKNASSAEFVCIKSSIKSSMEFIRKLA